MHRVNRIIHHLSQNDAQSLESLNTSQDTERVILLGPKPKTLNVDIGILSDLNMITSKTAIKDKFWSDGYGLFRNTIDRQTVLNARNALLTEIQDKYNLFSNVEKGILKTTIKPSDIPFTEGRNEFTQNPNILTVVENKSIHNIMKILLDCDQVKTFDYKWLRLVVPGLNTGVHVDRVYMNRGTENLLTCWIPLMDIRMELGTVFILDGSYYLPAFNVFQQTYGSIDAEKINLNGTGHFTQNPDEMKKFFKSENDYKIKWKSCDFKAGDVLIFTMRTVHMSSVNISQKHEVRISCDTRWLNANEIADSRYMYNEKTGTMGHASGVKFGLHNTDDDTVNENEVTIKQLRDKWGI
eukprot:86695_1